MQKSAQSKWTSLIYSKDKNESGRPEKLKTEKCKAMEKAFDNLRGQLENPKYGIVKLTGDI